MDIEARSEERGTSQWRTNLDPLHIDPIWTCQDKSFLVIHGKLIRILMESDVILVLENNVGNGILNNAQRG